MAVWFLENCVWFGLIAGLRLTRVSLHSVHNNSRKSFEETTCISVDTERRVDASFLIVEGVYGTIFEPKKLNKARQADQLILLTDVQNYSTIRSMSCILP